MRILIVGLKEPYGGVESAVLNYTERFDHDRIVTDFAFLCGEVSFADRLHGKAIYLPNRIRHPLAYRKKLRELFAAESYDAVWYNCSGLTNIDFLKEAKKQGVPTRIVHAHAARYSWGNPLMKYLVPYFHKKNQKRVEKYVTHFWTCSKKAAVFMFGETLAQKAQVIPNSVDTQKFTPNLNAKAQVLQEFGISEDALVVGHVGRMCTDKNQLFLLDIMKEVAVQNPNALLLFVGDGELREIVLSHANAIGVAEKVIFTGARKDVAVLLQAMDVFLLPSLSEAFPVTVVEAQAADTPCVVSSEAVVPEADMTGTTTFLSLQDAPANWATAVLKAAEKSLSGGAQKLAAAGFDNHTAATALQSFFEGVV